MCVWGFLKARCLQSADGNPDTLERTPFVSAPVGQLKLLEIPSSLIKDQMTLKSRGPIHLY